MFDKWRQYSYTAQKYQRHRYAKAILTFFILYIIYNCITAFFISVWSLDNNTMQPGLSYGDKLIFTSFTLPQWFSSKTEENQLPFKRGSIVLIDKGKIKQRPVPLKIIDGFVRFFSVQRLSIFSREGQYYIKRVIALPGDEIYMNNFVFRVKTASSPYSLTEFELSEKPYHPAIPQIPELWDSSLPFSGNMAPVILGPDECFVISDDRSNTNDSRTWGAVSPSMITARAVVRFWPIVKIERL